MNMNIKLYTQNYCYLDKTFYVSNRSMIYFNPNTFFDTDIDNFLTNNELFITNRFKDLVTKRVFINGKPQSINSITQKGVEIDIKATVSQAFDNKINYFENEVYNIADMNFKSNIENFKNDSNEFSLDEIDFIKKNQTKTINIFSNDNINTFKSESESDSDSDSGSESELDSKLLSKNRNYSNSDNFDSDSDDSDSDNFDSDLDDSDSDDSDSDAYSDSDEYDSSKDCLDNGLSKKNKKINNNKMKLNSIIKQTPSLKFTLIDRINLKNKKKLEKFNTIYTNND